MSTIKTIRIRLQITQAEFAEGIGCTQANIGHYEKGQSVPPDSARRVIAFAKSKGLTISFDDIYGDSLAESPANPAQVATEAVANSTAPEAQAPAA